METRDTVLKNAVSQFHNAEADKVHTVADAFDELNTYVAADTEWAHYVDADRREAYYAQTHYCEEPEPEIWFTVRHFDLDDWLVIDDSAVERVAEASEYPVGRLHAELGTSVDDNSVPVEFVGIRDDLASLHGMDPKDIQSAGQLAEAMATVSMSSNGYPVENETYPHRKRGPYAAEETADYALDKWLYQTAPAEIAAEYMLYPEHWYDGDTRRDMFQNICRS
ncbi:MAG: hypothetical protein ABEN55_08690 [Bradymonadaceae bacterium]